MSVQRWYIWDIKQKRTETGEQIVVYTDRLCHLWMRWSLLKPWITKIPRIDRGLVTLTDYHYCFDVYTDNEQEEEGDTREHTFIKEPWPYCQERWFYFWGTIAGQHSPSTSCIYQKHPVEPGPSGPCRLLTNCFGYGGMPQGSESVWGLVPTENFRPSAFRMWGANYFDTDVVFHLIFHIYEMDDHWVPISPPLVSEGWHGTLPFRPQVKQIDFSFPRVSLIAHKPYYYGYHLKYTPDARWYHRSLSIDKSPCFYVRYADRTQNPDGTFGYWSVGEQPLQICHDFFGP